MWQNDVGQDEVPLWSDTPTWVTGQTVYSGTCRGTVVSVDTTDATISVAWDDSQDRYGPITYPADATYLRKAMPWED